MAPQRVFQLAGTCNNYPWGKKGRQSLAAQLCARTPGTAFAIDDDQCYSEMWFGDYPDFPARVLETGEPLADVLQRDKATLLGAKVVDHFDAQLPFLPKILSIAKALPLQLHPNKDLAAKLHAQHPDAFTDPNHKPEIAIALSKFEVFAGFRPLADIQPVFTLAALAPFLPAHPVERWTDATLRAVCHALLRADAATVRATERALLDATPRAAFAAVGAPHIPALLPRLVDQYGPGDAGALVALTTMNLLVLDPLDALYIPADGIHAYLAGNIVECMARSNNVLNAGFCPPADRASADLFADTLSFRAHSRADVVLRRERCARSATGRTDVYSPPMSEFDMLVTALGGGGGDSDVVAPGDGPGVMIVTQGSGTMAADGSEFELKEGYIFYIAPGVEVKLESSSGLQAFTAVV